LDARGRTRGSGIDEGFYRLARLELEFEFAFLRPGHFRALWVDPALPSKATGRNRH
jgi:hypothetical protein